MTATVPNLPKEVVIEFPDGSIAPASLSKAGATLTIYGFADAAALPNASSPALVASASLKPGQTLIGLGADGSVRTAILSKVDADGVHADLGTLPAGAAVVNLSGDLVGIATAASGVYASADKILALLATSP